MLLVLANLVVAVAMRQSGKKVHGGRARTSLLIFF